MLVSHLHFDHLDLPSLRLLGREVRVVVPRGAGDLLARKGFGSVTELEAGEEIRLGALAIRGTPAHHDSGRMPFGRRVEPIGYVIDGPSSVYFAGDTDLFDGMTDLGRIDIALIPIAGWGPKLGPGHLDPRWRCGGGPANGRVDGDPHPLGDLLPLAHGVARSPPAFLELPVAEFQAHMREVAPDVDVRVLRPGDEVVLEAPQEGARPAGENLSAEDDRQ